MAKRCQAIYENGVFRLLTPIELEEHQEVSLLILENNEIADAFEKIYGDSLAYEDETRCDNSNRTVEDILNELDTWEAAFDQQYGKPRE